MSEFALPPTGKICRSIALIPQDMAKQDRWLVHWSYLSSEYDFISGQPQSGESFRECTRRAICEALELDPGGLLVSNMAQLTTTIPTTLPGEFEETALTVSFYIVALYGQAARQQVEQNSEVAWVSGAEVQERETCDGKPINSFQASLLKRLDVLPHPSG